MVNNPKSELTLTSGAAKEINATEAFLVSLERAQQELIQTCKDTAQELCHRDFSGASLGYLYTTEKTAPGKHFWSKPKKEIIYRETALWTLEIWLYYLTGTGELAFWEDALEYDHALQYDDRDVVRAIDITTISSIDTLKKYAAAVRQLLET